MLIIDNKTIQKHANHKKIIEAVKKSFLLNKDGKAYVPDRPVFEWKENKAFIMPCFTDEICGYKIITQYPNNRKIGKPTLDGVMILEDSSTGEPLAIMDGKLLTAMRTGAISGLILEHLSCEDWNTIGIIGLGMQGFYQAVYSIVTRGIENLYVYDINMSDYSSLEQQLKRITKKDITLFPCSTPEELAAKSDIIITATTSNAPVISNSADLFKEKCLISIGSGRPDMREFPPAIWESIDKTYITLEHGLKESGDLVQPINEQLLTNEKIHLLHELFYEEPLKKQTGKSYFFKVVGMALNDLTVAAQIYQDTYSVGNFFEF